MGDSSIWQWLDHLDKELFTFIHARASNEALDGLMLLLRNGFTWLPFYLFMLYWILRRENRKFAFPFILLSVATVALTDSVSARFLKPLIDRPRPCSDEALQPIIRHIINCAGEFSMPSTHASNHFGLASFWFFTILFCRNKRWYWLWLWAALVCYAQIYVGKHYPFDILVGAIFGSFVGWAFYKIFKRFMKKNLN